VNGLEKHVTLKGTHEGYFLILNETSSLDEIRAELTQLFDHLKKDDKYKQEFDLTIDSGQRIIDDEVKQTLKEKINKQTNFVIKRFAEDVIDKELAEQWHKDTSPLIVVKNVRNGQLVTSKRDIILIGDIRPGGLVRSSGSIIVIGNVQGILHAGAKGDEEAIIIAPFAFDGQVRISEHVEIIEKDEDEESEGAANAQTQIVFLNDLHMIEFAPVEKLTQIRPSFAKDVGGFEEWQRQL